LNNYHRHSHYSNVLTPDSSITNEQYAIRAKELGHKILVSMEHGFQGNYFETFALAKKHGLKFVYGAEAYWVKDRLEQDKTNSHICIFSKTNKGRKSLNLALAEANISGYYYKPRLDLDLILNLPPEDIFVTSACLAFWHYEDIEDIITKLHSHFKDNFMLEVQYHFNSLYIELNKKILDISNRHGIEMIVGMDSHYISDDQKIDREEVLKSKGIHYDNEDDWYMDYPDDKTTFSRLKEQGIFTDSQIQRMMDNTNIFETFDNYDDVDIFSQRIKLPSLYPELTQEEKDKKLVELVNAKWNEYKKDIPKEKHKEYIIEIKKELKIVIDVHMSDYLLYDYEVVKRAVEKGGMITPSGRGSAVSFFINTLLGLSKVDRISAPVKMFPERFMSTSRIGNLMDIDLNSGNPEVFAEAQKEISGEYNSYPMIAYGTFKKKSAWKMYAKAKDVDFEIANKISNQIGKYEEELKYTDDDEKDTVDVYDFIDKEYHKIYEDSIIYQGIISSKSIHPCAHLIYDFDIREEIGLIKVKSETTKKEYIVCLMDGNSAEQFKFMKNDLLKVDVVKLLYLLQEKTGFQIPTQNDIINICDGDEKVWNIYSNGCTLGVNQYEKSSTALKGMSYKPKNISDSCSFIAGIRPAFKSMYHLFEKREDFSYGIPSFDKIIRDCGVDASWVLYQEILMATLAFSDFPQSETYDIIKAISKKRAEKIMKVKSEFMKNFKYKVMNLDGLSEELADEATDKVWTVIANSCSYAFNASHSFCMAYDSLLCAYYKSHYPLDFYEVLLQEYTQKGNKDKVMLLKSEMEQHFKIHVEMFKFRRDNRNFIGDKRTNSMQQAMTSMKGFGNNVADYLYLITNNHYPTFIDLLIDLQQSPINQTQIQTLIKLNYFEEFGKSKKLMTIYEYFQWIDKKQINKEKVNATPFSEELIQKYSTETEKLYKNIQFKEIISEMIPTIPNEDISDYDKIIVQKDYLGYLDKNQFENPDSNYAIIQTLNKQYTPKLKVKSLTGKVYNVKMDKKTFNYNLTEGNVLYIENLTIKPASVKNEETGKWSKHPTKKEIWIESYKIIERSQHVN